MRRPSIKLASSMERGIQDMLGNDPPVVNTRFLCRYKVRLFDCGISIGRSCKLMHNRLGDFNITYPPVFDAFSVATLSELRTIMVGLSPSYYPNKFANKEIHPVFDIP